MKRYALWIHYSGENWVPFYYDTIHDVIDAISTGQTFGNPFVVTEILRLDIKPFVPSNQ